MTLKFKEWDSLSEAGIFDNIKNWLNMLKNGKILT